MLGGTAKQGAFRRWSKHTGRRVHLTWTIPVAAVGAIYILYLLAVHWWAGLLLEQTLYPSRPSNVQTAKLVLTTLPPVGDAGNSSTAAKLKKTPLLSSNSSRNMNSHSSNSTRDILVLYVFAYTDPEYLSNLKYFIREAIEGDEKSSYIIAVQMINELQDITLPELPSHARYVPHENDCYDWGTFGWLLRQTEHSRYKYFLFINSSVRGPYLPAYARGRLHWTAPFLQRLTATVKLVGSTISCEGSPLGGDVRGKWRRNPHVQSYAVATDRVGLGLLMKDKKVFHCHENRWQAIYYSELGSSAAILKAGYNIACLMVRYQNVNWKDKALWDCNARLSPTGEQYNDGISLDPLEVMFVKVKSHMLDNDLSVSKKAVRYEQWQQQQGQMPLNVTALSANEYLSDLPRFKTPHVLEVRARGARCFDFDYYVLNNPDLSYMGTSKDDLWKHFVYYGRFDARPFRMRTWLCPERQRLYDMRQGVLLHGWHCSCGSLWTRPNQPDHWS